MADMLERAARSACESAFNYRGRGKHRWACADELFDHHSDAYTDLASAALLAALDDVADSRLLAELGLAIDREIIFQIGEPTGFADAHREAIARAALAALRRAAKPVINPSNPSASEVPK